MTTGGRPPGRHGARPRGPARSRLACGQAVVLAIAIGGCGTAPAREPMVETVTPGVLTVATYGTIPLAIEVGPGPGELGGYAGEWINAYARDHDLKVKVVRMTFTAALFAVRTGTADVSPEVFYNADRARHVYFTYPADITTLHAFTKASFPWAGAAGLTGRPVGAVSGWAWIPYFARAFGQRLRLFTTPAEAKTALLNGQIDAYLDQNIQYFGAPFHRTSEVTAHPLRAGDLGIPSALVTLPSYLIVNCDEKVVANGLNDTMRHLQSSGRWAAILDRLNTAPAEVTLEIPPLRAPTNYC